MHACGNVDTTPAERAGGWVNEHVKRGTQRADEKLAQWTRRCSSCQVCGGVVLCCSVFAHVQGIRRMGSEFCMEVKFDGERIHLHKVSVTVEEEKGERGRQEKAREGKKGKGEAHTDTDTDRHAHTDSQTHTHTRTHAHTHACVFVFLRGLLDRTAARITISVATASTFEMHTTLKTRTFRTPRTSARCFTGVQCATQ